MMNSNLNSIQEEGFRLLVNGLGTAGAVNFLRQFDSGSGNYTEERTKLLEGATIDEIAARIQSRKGLGGKL
ncbi:MULTISPECIES: hypothetical protein [Desulfitobacterium]|uniref:Uncharacterized protein n=5 Tax=root TaxID=1 RepID=A0A1M7U9H3_9FIRM|nr:MULTISPECIES: hypothetical protein [Desulfitobacterium]ACL22487.1 conserved hypothetical protein [Desulfitobacterium hafniense DCB-2]KTE93827.1 hypothetical protein AT727_02405 [Desulfitobacterium hafniense]SHN79537.1 hypothetical protein SAMN02745215_03221 [Desulfitobacterium chlororespirans DSM 11544]